MDDNKDFKLNENGINPAELGEEGDIYFNVMDVTDSEVSSAGTSVVKNNLHKKIKSTGVRSTYLFFIIVIAVSMVLSIYAIFCVNDIFAITKTKSTVTITLQENVESTNDAIDILADKGLIKCKSFCKFFTSLHKRFIKNSRGEAYLEGPYPAGMYYLYGKMGLEGMIETLQGDSATSETVTLTFPEGYTVADIVDKLVENDVCDKTSLLSVIASTDFSYSLVTDLKSSESVPYRLEGYLFPDTYEFFVGENASSVVKKFLANGDTRITEKYRKQAKKLGYSMHEILTIASIIEKEAGSNDQMKDISSVIHNRLSDSTNFPSLGCQSTADYITNSVGPSLSSTSAHTADYYLNYYSTNISSTVVGLPAGPICNPGIAAIEAALYPKNTSNYYFFHDTKRNLYTAKTYSEFKSKIQTYAPYLSY